MPSNRGTNARGRIVNQSLGIISLCAALLACPAAVRAQSPAFTYQGQLKQSGVPFNGTVALGCTLWDAVAGGNQLGATINLPGVTVTNGLFTVTLNGAGEFGASAFNGDPRWLAISVNGTPLSPRQALTAAPYALHAARPWVTSGQDISYAEGNVGIGTNAPAHPLDVLGDTKLNGRIAAGNNGEIGLDSVYNKAFDFSHTITDFSTSPYWEPFLSRITVDAPINIPSIAVYGHELETVIPLGNVSNYHYVQGPYCAAFHEGDGDVDFLGGGNIGAETFGPGTVDYQVGAYFFSDVGYTGTSTINTNQGIWVVSGHGGTAGTVNNDYTIFVRTPAHDQPLANHYGIYLEDQDFGVNDSFAIYSAGGKSYLAGNLGIGTSAPQAKLHIGGEAGVDGVMFPDGTLQTTAATGGGGGLTLPFSGSVDFNGSALAVTNSHASGKAIAGHSTATGFGFPQPMGVYGESTATNGRGVVGSAPGVAGFGVIGSGGQVGVAGSGFTGVSGESTADGGRGVFGNALASTGVTYGVAGITNSPTLGAAGVYGENTATPLNPVTATVGVWGRSDSTYAFGVYGEAASCCGVGLFGVYGYASTGPLNSYAVYAQGRLGASGTKSFRIDHPDDPENKYLLHYSIESPEVLNAYSGKATLDAAGEAVVELPHYFAKINKDPRYTLTAIGAPMPMLHVAEEIDESALSAGARAGPGEPAPLCFFRIAGGAPGMKVSWEVKALRNDRWVQQRGAPVEVEKEGPEKGTYQHPELYGQPPEMGMNYDAERATARAPVTPAMSAANLSAERKP